MSRRTRSRKPPSDASSPDNSFDISRGSHDASRLAGLSGSDSFQSEPRSYNSFSEDFDEVDHANVSGSNMTYLVDVEDLDASAELISRDKFLGGDFSPRARRRSPRFSSGSPYSDGSSPGSPSSRKKTRRPESATLGRHSIHSETDHVSPKMSRSVGVKGAMESRERISRKQKLHKQPETNLLPTLPDWCWICVCLAVAGVVIFVIKPYISSQSEGGPEPVLSDRQAMLHTFNGGLDGLRESFPSQSTRFWRVVVAATRAVIRTEHPPEPAVLMLLVTKDSRDTATCFVKQYAELVTEAYRAREPLIMNVSRMDLRSPDDAKLYIDDTLSQRLGGGARVAVLHQLEMLPGQSAMIFHGYCDNDNAPHKDAVLVFTVEMTSVPSEDDTVAEDYLSELWARDLEIDKYTALLSRMAKSIAFMTAETADVLKESC